MFVQPLVLQRHASSGNSELRSVATCRRTSVSDSLFTGKQEVIVEKTRVQGTFRRRTRCNYGGNTQEHSMRWSLAAQTLAPQWTCQLGSPSIQIGRPKTSIKKDVGRAVQQPQEAQTDTERGSAKARPRRKTQEDEIPMFKVILLGDEEYVEAHVVTQLQKTVQIDKSEATRIFREAQSTGSSIVCVVCEEHAEFYAQQLRRQDIYVVVEKDE